MALNQAEISQVLREIAPVVRGGWIQKVYQPTARTLVFDIRVPGKTHQLLVSCEPGSARLHVIRNAPINPPKPPNFCQYMRAHFQGARIDDVRQVSNDRIVEFRLTTKHGPRMMVCHFIGQQATIVLLDGEGRVLRDLVGRQHERAARSHARPESRSHALAESRFPEAHGGDFPLSAAIEAYYTVKAATSSADTAQAARQHALKKALKKTLRRIDAWREDLAKADKYREYARYGELLKANVRSIKKGTDRITVIDYFDEAMPEVTIPLDPVKSPRGNMDDYFRKHRKGLTAERELGPRIDRAAQELSDIQKELATIERGTWAPAEPTPAGGAAPLHKRIGKGPANQRGRPFRRFTSSDGLPIFVGRNARENDELTFVLAKSDDLWLHARGTPGSHVVVRLEKGQQAPTETLLDAATLALLYSDLKRAAKGDVIYTKRKWVKKAKGQAPGAVTVTQEASVHVHLDRTRLQALKQRGTGD